MENARSEMIFQALKHYFKDAPDNLLLEITERLQKGQPLGSIPQLKLSGRHLKHPFHPRSAERDS